MKETKYRVWDKKYGKYLRGKILLAPDGQLYELVDDFHFPKINMVEVVIEQDTGLKDKNGVKIYEGDILKFKMHTGKYENYKIVFRDAMFEAINADDTNFISYSIWNIGEVIGNIHENKELLGDKE